MKEVNLTRVTVSLKNALPRTVTNQDGIFTLNLGSATSRTLVFSFISMQPKRLTLRAKQRLM